MLKKIYGILAWQFGLDPRRLIKSVTMLPRYVRNLITFKRKYKGKLHLYPCLNDWHEEGGSVKNEYFWQDLYVARKIHEKQPKKHVDIGSRIDGFVAHVASFRTIEIFDIRPMSSDIPNVLVKQADLMLLDSALTNYCDSISCLHALEHFGLGRYGDPINPSGHIDGLKNIVKILKSGGILHLSIPIGIERFEFNAHRILDPRNILQLANENELSLSEFAWIENSSTLIHSLNPELDITTLSNRDYVLGIFEFIKN